MLMTYLQFALLMISIVSIVVLSVGVFVRVGVAQLHLAKRFDKLEQRLGLGENTYVG